MLDWMMLLLFPLVSFVITFILVPQIIKKSYIRGLLGVDVNKIDKPQIPTTGGLTIFSGFLGALTFTGLFDLNQTVMLAILLSSSLGALIGLIDDMFVLSKKLLVLLTLAMGLPIISFQAGSTMIYLTPIGPSDLGVLFWLLVPFIFAFLTNGVNIYAIYNGLEAGLGLVTSASLAVCAMIYGSQETTITLLALSGSLLAFLRWNRYPSKIFPGNSGTYLIGAILASTIIAGVIKLAGVVACMPYLVNFVLRAYDKFNRAVGELDQDGLVKSSKLNGLWALCSHNRPRNEARIVNFCMLVQVIFGVVAIVLSFFHNQMIIQGL
jgi:UDP-N-acetylglucosamine--dolichyl-phosphate N-acetylglucosaminephosphotransferase